MCVLYSHMCILNLNENHNSWITLDFMAAIFKNLELNMRIWLSLESKALI